VVSQKKEKGKLKHSFKQCPLISDCWKDQPQRIQSVCQEQSQLLRKDKVLTQQVLKIMVTIAKERSSLMQQSTKACLSHRLSLSSHEKEPCQFC
jgi:hypothetical protein